MENHIAKSPRVISFVAFLIFYFLCPLGTRAETPPRILVDRGLYQEGEWSRQLDVTPDDRFILLSDKNNGVRFLDATDGSLVNAFEGHSLGGDARYDAATGLFLTTGDGKLKVWDVAGQKFVREIVQNFHSQFMIDPYVDSKREYLFANHVKYGFATKKLYKKLDYGRDRLHYFGASLICVVFRSVVVAGLATR